MAVKFIPCSVAACNGNAHRSKSGARGLCTKHYARLLRHGDVLAKINAANGEAQDFYKNVVMHYEANDCLIWPYWRTRGYAMMRRAGKNRFVSRFICEDVYGDPPTPQHEAAHSCGKGNLGCVSPKHITWKTPVENQADRIVHGTHGQGERNARAKLTEAQVRQILALNGIETRTSIAQRFGVSSATVGMIHKGKRWPHLRASSQ